jgi:hypothetical protein
MLLPGTLVFCVVLNEENPIIFLSRASSSSSSDITSLLPLVVAFLSICIVSGSDLVGLELTIRLSSSLTLSRWGGRSRSVLDPRGGDLARVDVFALLRVGERDLDLRRA